MALARRLTSLGRAARGEAGVKVRQPLARALVFLPAGLARDPARHRGRRAQRRRDRHGRRAERGAPVRAGAELQDRSGPRLGERVQGAQAGTGRARRRGRGGRARGGSVHHGDARRRAGRAVARGRGAARAGPAGLRRLPRGRRGGGARSHARRRACASGGWPATSCARCRTCARRAGSRCPTASCCTSSDSTPSPSTSTSSPARCWPSRSSVRTRRRGGDGARTRRRAARAAGAGLDREGRGRARLAAGVEHLATAPPPARRGRVASRCAIRWRSMPSMWAATAWSRTARPSGVSTTWMLRRSFGQFCRSTSPASTIRSTRRVTPPVVSATSALSRLMVRRPSGAAPTWMRTSKKTSGIPTDCSSSRPRRVGQAAVGADDEAHELDPLVVHLAEDAAGASSVGGGATARSSSPPFVEMVAVPISLPLSLPRTRSAVPSFSD